MEMVLYDNPNRAIMTISNGHGGFLHYFENILWTTLSIILRNVAFFLISSMVADLLVQLQMLGVFNKSREIRAVSPDIF